MGPPQAGRRVLRLALFDLDDTLVDDWCAPGEAGVREPDPETFRRGAPLRRRPRRRPVVGWVIGDDPVLDVDGVPAEG